MRFVISMLAVALILSTMNPLGADESDSEAARVARELIQLSGGAKMGKQVMEQMIKAQRMTSPEVPDEFWEQFLAEARVEEFTEMIVPIYTKHLQVGDMKAAIAFYKTPAGQRLLEKMPAMLQESMTVGQQWGMKIGMEIANRLKENGYKVEGI